MRGRDAVIMLKTRFNPLWSAVRALRQDVRGGIAVIGAVVSLPLCVVSLGALEFHHIVQVRTTLQDAVDAATLAAGRSGKDTDAELKAVGLPVLQAHMAGLRAARDLDADDVSFVNVDGRVTGTARLCIKPLVSGAFGVETCPVATAEVMRENTALEVVLVLDSSDSMQIWSPSAGMRRIDSLEAAAKSFITTLESLDNPALADDVRIGLAPYAGSVRIDPANRGRWWLDGAGASSVNANLFYSRLTFAPVTQSRFALYDQMGIDWRGCVESRPGDYAVSDSPPVASDPNSLFVPYFAPDELDLRADLGQSITYPNNYLDDGEDNAIYPGPPPRPLTTGEKTALYANNWREIQYVVEKYTAAAVDASGLNRTSTDRGPNRWCKMDAVFPLSSDFAALRTSLDDIPTARHTNIPMGLAWGWHLLSPNAPFSLGRPYGDPATRKVLVLLTDNHNLLDAPGEREATANNNGSFYDGLGYVWRERLGLPLGSTHAQLLGALDGQMNTLCTRMRTAGVVIYTIQLEGGITDNAQLINCSGAANFKNAVNASELNAVFQTIAEQIALLRVAE